MREGLQKVTSLDDTIVAISTPVGHSGLGIVRLSGSQASAIVEAYLQPITPLEHRRASLGSWCDRSDHDEVLDEVIATLFRAPHSYTGEDVIEISAHGNPFTLQKILALCLQSGARLAGPGEFTERA